MPHEDLRHSLKALHDELEDDAPLDEAERALLVQLRDDIEDALEHTSEVPRPKQAAVKETAMTASERFQASHPVLTGVLNRLVDTLVGLGL